MVAKKVAPLQGTELPEDAGDRQVHAAAAQQRDRELLPTLPRPLQLPPGGIGDERDGEVHAERA